MKMTLARKMLIIVAIPVVFQLAFVGVLTQLLRHANEVARKESHAKQALSAAQEMTKQCYEVALALFSYSVTHNPLYGRRYDDLNKHVLESFQQLRLDVIDSPEQLERVSRLEQLWNRASGLLNQAKVAIDHGSMDLGTVTGAGFKKEIQDAIATLIKEQSEFSEHELSIQIQGPAAEARSNLLLSQWIAAAIPLNILLAVIITVLYNRSTTSRLQLLMDNARRIGEERPLHPPLSGSDEITLLDTVMHDVTTELAEARQKRKEIERLKQDFVQMVSHDMRTPLSSVLVFLDLLLTGAFGKLSERGEQKVVETSGSIDRLIALINDLLDMEKMESGKMEVLKAPAQLTDIFAQAQASVHALAEQQGITLVAQAEPIDILADSDRLVQVIVNLLSNAIKFSPSSSKVTLSYTTAPGSITIKISDEGRGIPADMLDSVFDRFKQVERADAIVKKGSGLGLAICKAIVEAHEGTIGVESEPGKGSTFWFTLPNSTGDSTSL